MNTEFCVQGVCVCEQVYVMCDKPAGAYRMEALMSPVWSFLGPAQVRWEPQDVYHQFSVMCAFTNLLGHTEWKP